MAIDKSYERLGLFLVVTFVVVIATGVFFLLRFRSREEIDLVTYTTGNVSGLNVGSQVRFRGVPLGRVEELRIEPRGSLVEVDFDVLVDRLAQRGASVESIRREAAIGSLASLRAQVVGNPVTGEAYLELDMPSNPPPPVNLTFTPARVYVPFMPTTFETMQDRLPVLLDRAVAIVQMLDTVIGRLPANFDRSEEFFANVEQIIRSIDLPAMSLDSRRFFTQAATQIEKMTSDFERITADLDHALGPAGTLARFVDEMHSSIAAANLEATTRTTREAMNETTLAAEDLRRSLPAIRETLSQLRDLARFVEEQPEAVVYGPRGTKEKR